AGQERERLTAERIDGPLPAHRFERLVTCAEAGRIDDLRSAEASQVVGFDEFARRGDDLEAALRQQIDGDAGHPAGGAVDEDLAALRRESIEFAEVDREGGRVARDADRDGLQRTEAVRHPRHPGSRRARALRVAAMLRDAEAVAVRDDVVARGEPRVVRRLDGADGIDAADARKAPDDAA